MIKKIITTEQLDDFLNARTSTEETLEILEAMVFDPSLQEYVISSERMNYGMELQRDYGSFLPASRLAADDGKNLCDFQCETYILRNHQIQYKEDKLAEEARNNYWLRSQGTPLYNMGRLLEANGLLVERIYDADLQQLVEAVEVHEAIVVVNGNKLEKKEDSDLFDEDNPNHAVVVISVDKNNDIVALYNPSSGNKSDIYPLPLFMEAWNESKNYMVLVRSKKYDSEYIPHPIDVSDVILSPDLLQLSETIAENAHNVWAAEKKRKNPNIRYAPLDENGNEVSGHNHYFVPYSQLSEEDKKPDIDMALNTIKLLKRLGYRIININELHRCPKCGEPIEMHNLFCSHCGKELTWEDFK